MSSPRTFSLRLGMGVHVTLIAEELKGLAPTVVGATWGRSSAEKIS